MACPTAQAEPVGFCGQSGGGCDVGSSCNGGCCCRPKQVVPSCPTGGLATATCAGAGASCGAGRACIGGGCCPMPSCPSGQPAVSACGVGQSCPAGNVCNNGGCCPQPTCGNGVLAISSCAQGCPSGFSCGSQGGCCPQVTASCPNRLPALQDCSRGTPCPSGFGCTSGGGCCQLAARPTCPLAQQSLSQCAGNNACPMGSSCNAATRTCCAPEATPLYGGQCPGAPCTADSQCNGFGAGAARCLQNSCACAGNSFSNGVTCAARTMQVQSAINNACSSLGGCRLAYNKVKRRPQVEDAFTADTEPLWWKPATDGVLRCPNATEGVDPDASCTPDQFCLLGTCVSKLWPGELGCRRDDECSRRCASAYCAFNDEKETGECRCRDGFTIFGACFKSCPPGTTKDGHICKVVNTDEEHWQSRKTLEYFNKMNQCGHEIFV